MAHTTDKLHNMIGGFNVYKEYLDHGNSGCHFQWISFLGGNYNSFDYYSVFIPALTTKCFLVSVKDLDMGHTLIFVAIHVAAHYLAGVS